MRKGGGPWTHGEAAVPRITSLSETSPRLFDAPKWEQAAIAADTVEFGIYVIVYSR